MVLSGSCGLEFTGRDSGVHVSGSCSVSNSGTHKAEAIMRAGRTVLIVKSMEPGSDFARVRVMCMYARRCGHGTLEVLRSGGYLSRPDISIDFSIDRELDSTSAIGRVTE